VVLYGCETWSLILREEHGLKVFQNRVLRRKLHNEERYYLYSLPIYNYNDEVREDEMCME
jgi:hypothetical protein